MSTCADQYPRAVPGNVPGDDVGEQTARGKQSLARDGGRGAGHLPHEASRRGVGILAYNVGRDVAEGGDGRLAVALAEDAEGSGGGVGEKRAVSEVARSVDDVSRAEDGDGRAGRPKRSAKPGR